MAQPVNWATLDFDSGHDLRVLGSSPTSGSLLNRESSLSSSPFASSPISAISFFLSKVNKLIFKNKKEQGGPGGSAV